MLAAYLSSAADISRAHTTRDSSANGTAARQGNSGPKISYSQDSNDQRMALQVDGEAAGSSPLDRLAIGELPEPEPLPGWALVKMAAASLNHHDLWTLQGVSSRPISPPQILGCDGAGTVVAYGPGPVPGEAPSLGSSVLAYPVISCRECAMCRSGNELLCRDVALLSEGGYQGTLAELFPVPVANLIALPETVTPDAAASMGTTYLTAYHMIYERARLIPGSTLLVHGATGGVAVAVMQLAKIGGISVIATARSEAKREFARSMGAVLALESDTASAREIQKFTAGGVDAVMETVGAPTWELSLRSVKPDGIVVVSGATGGGNPPAMLQRVFWRQIRIAGSTMGTFRELNRLVALLASGQLDPLLDGVTPLSEADVAFAKLYRGDQSGKLIISSQ
ncbi:MAG: zinc-binding dehydrogenase [Acidimicrobiales bacterium]